MPLIGDRHQISKLLDCHREIHRARLSNSGHKSRPVIDRRDEVQWSPVWYTIKGALAACRVRIGGTPITQIDQQAIEDRAHAIWEREGRPDGRDRDHWLQAVWELAGENAKAAAAKMPKPTGKGMKKPARNPKSGGGGRSKASK